MIYWSIAAALFVLGGASFFYGTSLPFYRGEGWVFLGSILSFFSVIMVIVWFATLFANNYNERQCGRFERETGYETKFVRFSHWTVNCYAKTDTGKYVPYERLKNDRG